LAIEIPRDTQLLTIRSSADEVIRLMRKEPTMEPVSSRPVSAAGILLFTTLLVCGCGGDAATQPKPATTPASPREALIQVAEATHAGNEARVLAAVEASETQAEFLRVVTQYVAAVTQFRDTFVEAYGQQAWNDFQDDNKAPEDGNAKFTLSDPQKEIAKIRKLSVDDRGDEAFCQSVDEPGETVRIIKVENGWRVDAGSICPQEEEMQKTVRQFRPMAEIIREYQKAIGRPGINPDDIDAELGRALAKLLTGFESPAPHRFNVNEI
jgi:hypothetical protein